MKVNLARPAATYSTADQASVRTEVERALARCQVAGQQIDKLVLQSPDGNLWQVTVSNAGALSTTAL